MPTLQEREEYPLIEEDEILHCVLIGAGEETKPFKSKAGEDIVKATFKFKVTEGPHAERRLYGETWPNFYRGSELYQWVATLLNTDELPKDFTFEYTELLDLPVRVVVGVRAGKEQEDGTQKQYNFVSSVLPADADASRYSQEEPF